MRVSVDDAEKYGGQGGGGYFSLKDDGDTARVRFLYDSIEDVEGYCVHEVQIGDKKRYVNCLREYGDPIDKCPFCEAKKFTTVKYFVPLYNLDEDRVQTWERGKKFGKELASMCAHYPHLVSHTFDIERNGKKGDQGTFYKTYEVERTDGVTLDDFDVPSPLGTHVLDKTADEMVTYLNTGSFPSNDSQTFIRRGSSDRDRHDTTDRDIDRERRTPNRREVY